MSDVKIVYVGFRDNRFNYIATVNGHDFTYFEGVGHSKVSRSRLSGNKNFVAIKDDDVICAVQKANRGYGRKPTIDYYTYCYRKVPSSLDVLSCLKSDAECGDMSFNEFCDNYGYDNDSLKALDVYRQCMSTADKLRGYKFPKELDEDY